MSVITPDPTTIEFNGRVLVYKCLLESKKGKWFSFRCIDHSTMKCNYLLSIPINDGNYTSDYKCIAVIGAKQASSLGHSENCNKAYKKHINDTNDIYTNFCQC